MYPEPIILLGSPRSGTSLIASIFAAHGVWVGTSRPSDEGNPEGYFENIMLSEVRYRMGHGDGLSKDLVHQLLESDGYEGGPWLVKHSPPTWRAWRQFSPKWILIKRNPVKLLESRIKCGQWDMTREEHEIAIATDLVVMDGIEFHYSGLEIWTDKLFSGCWSELEDAFEYCGLTLDVDKVKRILKPSLWHG